MNSLKVANKMGNIMKTVKAGDLFKIVEVRTQEENEELEIKCLASIMKYAFGRYIPNNSKELNGFKEYAEWLKSGGDKLEFKSDDDEISRYIFKNDEIEAIIWNKHLRGKLTFYYGENGMTDENLKCTQSHKCSEHNHLNYFTPIAENWYRRWKLEQLVGKL